MYIVIVDLSEHFLSPSSIYHSKPLMGLPFIEQAQLRRPTSFCNVSLAICRRL